MKKQCPEEVKSRKMKPNGFTLVELMVVIVIIGLLSTMVVINVLPSQDVGEITKARGDVAKISQAVALYRSQIGVYPSTDEGLQALVRAPQGLRRPERYPKGGFIPVLPDDPWGTPYQYLYPGQNLTYDVYSLGADGRPGGEGINADIGNWQ